MKSRHSSNFENSQAKICRDKCINVLFCDISIPRHYHPSININTLINGWSIQIRTAENNVIHMAGNQYIMDAITECESIVGPENGTLPVLLSQNSNIENSNKNDKQSGIRLKNSHAIRLINYSKYMTDEKVNDCNGKRKAYEPRKFYMKRKLSKSISQVTNTIFKINRDKNGDFISKFSSLNSFYVENDEIKIKKEINFPDEESIHELDVYENANIFNQNLIPLPQDKNTLIKGQLKPIKGEIETINDTYVKKQINDYTLTIQDKKNYDKKNFLNIPISNAIKSRGENIAHIFGSIGANGKPIEPGNIDNYTKRLNSQNENGRNNFGLDSKNVKKLDRTDGLLSMALKKKQKNLLNNEIINHGTWKHSKTIDSKLRKNYQNIQFLKMENQKNENIDKCNNYNNETITETPKIILESKDKHSTDDEKIEIYVVDNVTFLYKFGLKYPNSFCKLQLRKEFYSPTEPIIEENLEIIFDQLLSDILDTHCVKISKERRMFALLFLDRHKINRQTDPKSIPMDVKLELTKSIKNSDTYFCRYYHIYNSKDKNCHLLGIHSNFIIFAQKSHWENKHNIIIEKIMWYNQILALYCPSKYSLLVKTKRKTRVIYASNAKQINLLIEAFLTEIESNNVYVEFIRNVVSDDENFLSCKKGQLAKLEEISEFDGYYYGNYKDKKGYIDPVNVTPVPLYNVPSELFQEKFIKYEDEIKKSENYKWMHNSLLKFGVEHFRRQNIGPLNQNIKYHTRDEDNTEAVKEKLRWTNGYLKDSLINFNDPHINKLAVRSFKYIHTFMEDSQKKNKYELVMWPLKKSKQCSYLKDEIICQICKQLIDNYSLEAESVHMGFVQLYILTLYFLPSIRLINAVKDFLYTAKNIIYPPYKDLIQSIIYHLQVPETKLYQNNLSKKEFNNILNSVIYQENIYLISEKCFTCKIQSLSTARDILLKYNKCYPFEEDDTIENYKVYMIFHDTKSNNKCKIPLLLNDYINDVKNLHDINYKKGRPIYLIIKVHNLDKFDLKNLRNDFHINEQFNQVMNYYLSGYYIADVPNNLSKNGICNQISILSAIVQKFSSLNSTKKYIKKILPKYIETVAKLPTNEWVSRIYQANQHFNTHLEHDSLYLQRLFLNILSKWPLYGFIFQNVKMSNSPEDHLLAINNTNFVIINNKSVNSYKIDEIKSLKLEKKMKTPFEEQMLLNINTINNQNIQISSHTKYDVHYSNYELISEFSISSSNSKIVP
ncbi:hypothetical protein A3Q56_01253 [Intoshia linei]|uniref:MyTH4 domain-containing protein n=1 Tax=Intoshia linei TaxID=1819745 RepID=A0A177B9P2_9BILA|nr:hypothetical protein A3Q56_01253 [Intoshia linei]